MSSFHPFLVALTDVERRLLAGAIVRISAVSARFVAQGAGHVERPRGDSPIGAAWK